MAEATARTLPDFWSFLQGKIAALDEESKRVQSDSDMKNLLDRWLHPQNGVLAKLEKDPPFALARPSAKQICVAMIRNRVRQVEHEWDIWRSIFEE